MIGMKSNLILFVCLFVVVGWLVGSRLKVAFSP